MTLPGTRRPSCRSNLPKTYGRPPRWIVAAPGRVNVIGEHTDYNDGFVLPMAIERYAVMAADKSADGQERRFRSAHVSGDEPALIDLSAPVKPGPPKWANYPRGVIAGFLARGCNPGGSTSLLHSTVPLGGGLSSSAALEVCTATLLEAVTGKKLDPVEKALLCQKAEHEFAGVPCGIMDQFISVMGRENHLLLLDCRSRKTELVPMNDPSVALLIINTNVKHELAGGEYAKRRAQCEAAAKILGVPSLRDATADALEHAKGKMDDVVYRRARHVIGEIERTVHAAEGIRASNWPTVGQLMYASHCFAARRLRSQLQGTGRGGGNCRRHRHQGRRLWLPHDRRRLWRLRVALVKADAVDAITKKIAADYKKKTGIEATIFSSRPAAGATIVKG